MQTTPDSSPSKKFFPWVVLGLMLAGVAVLILNSDNEPKLETPETASKRSSELIDKARLSLSDSAPVIGVSLNGKHRAYPIQLMMRPDQHVLNDLYGDQPLSVTYCDVDKCVRVFTDPSRKQRLDLNVGGSNASRAGKLLLKVGERLYWQDSGAPLEATNKSSLPFTKVDHVETTWGKWRESHPDTDRYVGKGEFLPNEP